MINVTYNGEYFKWNVKVCNSGPHTTKEAKVVNTISEGVSVSSYVASKGTYDTITQTWTIGTLEVGKCYELVLQMRVSDIFQTPFTMTSVVSGKDFDPVLINNTATNRVADECLSISECISVQGTPYIQVLGEGSVDDPYYILLKVDDLAEFFNGGPTNILYLGDPSTQQGFTNPATLNGLYVTHSDSDKTGQYLSTHFDIESLTGGVYGRMQGRDNEAILYLRRANGTGETKTQVLANELIGAVYAEGYNGETYSFSPIRMEFYAGENLEPLSRGGGIRFKTVPIGGSSTIIPLDITPNGALINGGYGAGTKTVAALSKTRSVYLSGYATDGTKVEVEAYGDFADDTAAGVGSVPVGGIYYNTTNSKLHTRMT